MPIITTEVYIDGTLFLSDVMGSDIPYDVLSTGIDAEEGGVWTYSGTGTFLGFSTTQGATTPDEYFAVGDSSSFVAGNIYYLYSVAQVQTSGKMYLGTSSISKMYIGQNEVSKVYLGQDLVYEKSSAQLISFTIDNTSYQAESGMTWGEWVDSAYNTGYFYINTGAIFHANTKVGVVICDDSITSNTTINDNGTYILFNPGNCD